MKIISILMVCALAACDGKKANPSTPTSNADSGSAATAPTGDGVPCTQEVALECPEGQIDGCLKTPAEGTTHTCVAK